MYKDCYRGLTAIKEVLGQIIWDIMDDFDGPYLTPTYVTEKVSQWLVDNEYEISKYGIPDEDVPSIMDRICDAEVNEAITGKPGLMDVADMIMHKKPAMDRCPEGSDHLDRCPEDILKEEIEK